MVKSEPNKQLLKLIAEMKAAGVKRFHGDVGFGPVELELSELALLPLPPSAKKDEEPPPRPPRSVDEDPLLFASAE